MIPRKTDFITSITADLCRVYSGTESRKTFGLYGRFLFVGFHVRVELFLKLGVLLINYSVYAGKTVLSCLLCLV